MKVSVSDKIYMRLTSSHAQLSRGSRADVDPSPLMSRDARVNQKKTTEK